MLTTTIAGAVAVGVCLGLLGGGGSILAVPLLVYAAQLVPEQAIATSLFVVGTTSAVAAIPHARAGHVCWRTGLTFAAATMAGAYGGGRVAGFIPGSWLLVTFGLLMLATSTAMIRSRRNTTRVPARLPLPRVLGYGTAIGFITGLVGAGGGFLVVPALTLLGSLAMSSAVGTSLVVIALNSGAGLAGHLSTVTMDWALALTVSGAAIGGSIIGERIAARIDQQVLRKAFGYFVLAAGALFLVTQVPPGLQKLVTNHPVLAILLGAAVFGILPAFALSRRQRTGENTDDVDAQTRVSNGQH